MTRSLLNLMINLTHVFPNSTFTVKLGRINNDLNNKFNEEVNAGFSKINTELNSKLTVKAEKTRHVMMTSLRRHK
ncbi:hypothetical protein C1646_731730, partial [Rhizophagus diaphanus]